MNGQLSEIQNSLTDLDSGAVKDRTKLDQMDMKIDALTSLVENLYDRLPRTEEKIKNAVADGLAETVEPVVNLVDRLKRVTKTIVEPLEKKKTIWHRLWNRGDKNDR